MNKSCKNCFHCKACTMADADGHIPGEDYDVGETCCEYINDADVFVEKRKGDKFRHFTDEVFELYWSFQKSGFTEGVAQMLTKEYLAVACELETLRLREVQSKKIRF